MPPWTFHILSFGCKVNQYEGQSLQEAWQRQGGVPCEDPAEAQVVCVNTCAITAKAERNARNAVARLRREAPGARIVLTGCATDLYRDKRHRPSTPFPVPDLLVRQGDKAALLEDPVGLLDGTRTPSPSPEPGTAFPPFDVSACTRARPVVKLQDGCSHGCAFCIVPQARGGPASRPFQDVLAECRRLLEAGFPELVLSGINLAQYRHEGMDFWDMIAALDAALAPDHAGTARLRISSLKPSQLDARGTDILAGARLLCPHLHVSLQHASPSVLAAMKRPPSSADDLEAALERLRPHWPVMGLGADIMTGFPGETEEDVEGLLAYLERIRPTYAHVFPFSRRPGTAAWDMEPVVPRREKNARAARVRDEVARSRDAFLRGQTTLERVDVVADRDQPAVRLPDGRPRFKGIDQYYVPCYFPGPERPGRLRPMRPAGLVGKGMLVEPMPTTGDEP
ncbi:MAG: radical SAM protein [Desulfovibrio sp.]|jgi:MiaB/RimO family radical SAM methylthiotransferase|nr:radical SAM protein [Desulfovibrio sp.]